MILTVSNNTPAPRLPKRETIADVWATIADTYPGITLEQVRAHDRRFHVSQARFHLVFELWIMRNKLSSNQIGRLLGGRNHTTIIYAARAHAHRALGMPQGLSRDQMRAELRAREAAELEAVA